jgi:outer membrane protein assembly factor BamB
MKRSLIWLMAATFAGSLGTNLSAEDWGRFRGPNGSGVAVAKSVATDWAQPGATQWSIDLPGPGGSSPIVVGDKLFITCYTGYGVSAEQPGQAKDLKRHLICYDRNQGTQVWIKTIDSTVDEDPYKGFITQHGYASSTPVTDGTHIYVWCGKTGVIAFDLNGQEVWRQSVGTKSDPAQWGDGASPILVGDLLIVNAGITDHAFIALNKLTGKVEWRIEDPKFTNNWGTPIVVKAAGRDELVCSAPGKIMALDPKTGKEYWRADSPLKETVCASLVQLDGVVFLMGGRQGSAIAVRCGGSGDVSATNTVWSQPLRSGIGTPVVADGKLFWIAAGLAICADCKTGKELFKERIKRPDTGKTEGGGQRGPTGDYASALLVGDKVLVMSRGGQSQFWKTDATYTPVADNAFADDLGPFNGTPAISDDSIFIRSDKRLYAMKL